MKSFSCHARDANYQYEHASYGCCSTLFHKCQKHEDFTTKIPQMFLFSVFWVISFDVISQVEKIRILITTIKTELELAFRMYLHIESF